ncbi:Hypothetical_protein [Hexamita inflata]|uniref:Hypothetical_protein n=1 Tax=Hexamita inflata TaxID=28002 RepID=A0AA86UHP3_9EUKA|nr:Hypothetical protein HINF_LOCUS39946 [Hexamita inflata]
MQALSDCSSSDLIQQLQILLNSCKQHQYIDLSNTETQDSSITNEPSQIAYDLKPLTQGASNPENSSTILTKERLRAFEGELFRAIQQYFAETPFQTLKEAIVHHKAFCARTGKKVHLNFAQLGETCGLSESQARNAFETVKQQRLDFLEPEVKRGLLERLRQLWEAETAEDFATKRKIVLEQVEKEFRFADQHSLNYKAVTNVMNYQINKLKAK